MIAFPHLGLGKRDVFVGVAALRTAVDFAACLDHIANVMLPAAEKIVLVMDNLNTHNTASLYEAFAPGKARIKLKSLYPVIWTLLPSREMQGFLMNLPACPVTLSSRGSQALFLKHPCPPFPLSYRSRC